MRKYRRSSSHFLPFIPGERRQKSIEYQSPKGSNGPETGFSFPKKEKFKLSFEQRQALSRELLSSLDAKVKKLKSLANRRSTNLLLDLDPDSEKYSSMRPEEDDSNANDNIKILQSRQNLVKPLKSQSNNNNSPNEKEKKEKAWTMDRLFPNNDLVEATVTTSPIKNRNKMKNRNNGIKRNQLDKKTFIGLEHQLNNLREQSSLHSADDFTMKYDIVSPPPIVVNHRVILEYTAAWMNLPSNHQRFTQYYLDIPFNQPYEYKIGPKLLKDMFWYIHMKFFFKDASNEQTYLYRQISQSYVSYLEVLGRHKDFFLKYLPLAIATSVCLIYHYLFPVSRHLYSRDFKDCIYMECVTVLTGTTMCPVSVKLLRDAVFPVYEGKHILPETTGYNHTTTLVGLNQSSNTRPASVMGSPAIPSTPIHHHTTTSHIASLTSLPRTPINRSHQQQQQQQQQQGGASSLVTTTLKDNIKGYLAQSMQYQEATGSLVEGSSKNLLPAKHLRLRQIRHQFHPTKVNPLIESYTGYKHPHKVAPIKRTMPVPWCRVGGENTHTGQNIDTALHNEIFNQYVHSKDVFTKDLVEVRAGNRDALRNIETEKAILHAQGSAYVNRFCGDILNVGLEERRRLEKRKLDENKTKSHQQSSYYHAADIP